MRGVPVLYPDHHLYTTTIPSVSTTRGGGACIATVTSSIYLFVSLACSSHASRTTFSASLFAIFYAFVFCNGCCGFVLLSFVLFRFWSSSFSSRVPSSLILSHIRIA
ncbi:hypothetical protein K438DRAFT_978486 [Mycena galopus ATCC 62051]|nr:hypothetical protein K438DRAFT_978486 [Mycena galopus ATCC 62051]